MIIGHWLREWRIHFVYCDSGKCGLHVSYDIGERSLKPPLLEIKRIDHEKLYLISRTSH